MKPYYIEKGTKPPAKRHTDEEYNRAIEELTSLVKENQRLLLSKLNELRHDVWMNSERRAKLIEAAEKTKPIFDRAVEEGYEY